MSSSALALRQRAHDVRMLGRGTLVAFALVWWALIAWLSAVPSLGTEGGGLTAHVLLNAGHAPLFGVLAAGIAFAAAARAPRPVPGIAACALALVATFVAGGIDELHQAFVPGRTSSWLDVATDTVGAAVVLLGLRYLASPRSTLAGFALRVVGGAAVMLASGIAATTYEIRNFPQ
ncbi:MAG TPA: VanZ family protein [Planctomycetota bacterium]|nr:VanZ family protein [Planctomycetota bacterium]